MTVIAVLGLGEAGGAIARDLVAAGAVVRGYDPLVAASGGIVQAGSEGEAASGSDLVLSVNSAHDAVAAFKAGIGGVGDGAVWADLNTGSPGLKRELDGIARQGGVPFADVAIMAPVPGRGLRTPMLAAGDGAARVAALLGPLGARVEVMDAEAGAAAGRKLLRSVFFKGLAGSVVEALEAARAAAARTGCAATSSRSCPRPASTPWTGSWTGRTSTPSAAPPRWRPRRPCWTSSTSRPPWPRPAATC
ncbi:NAD(P)-binding domain-containing protein [Actinomadura madurae]|nr:NAD(P)-binding domain-containing protein [Actinomadura madurae]MCQ0005111.1 NAD(P)-binding domain-containing protein [Actinomadura madurae]